MKERGHSALKFLLSLWAFIELFFHAWSVAPMTDEHSTEAPITPAAKKPKTQIPVANNTKRDWIDKVTLGFEGFGLAVLVVYTIATIVYAIITNNMWKEMQKQTRIQRETGINTERAWLGLDAELPIKISELKIGPPRFEGIATYRIKNFGHGPAFKIASNGWITTNSEEMEREAKFSCQENLAYTEGTLRVGPQIPQPPPMGRILFPGQILERDIGQPSSPFIGPAVPNAKFIWFIGCISYKDQFGTSHWTRFCMLTPEWVRVTFFDEHIPLHMYGMYNDTDDDTKSEKTN
jgi:hypothetical protein